MSAGELAAWSLAILVAVVCSLGVLTAVWLAVELVADGIRDTVRKRRAKRAEPGSPGRPFGIDS